MSENLVNLEDLMAAMEQLKDTNQATFVEMDEEMQASQRRYEEYIKKNIE